MDPRLLRAAPALRRHVAALVPLVIVRAGCTVGGAVLLAEILARIWPGGVAASHARNDLLLLAVVAAVRAAADGAIRLAGDRAAPAVRRQLRAAGLARILAGAGDPRGPATRDRAGTAYAVGPDLDRIDGYVTRTVPALVSAAITPVLVLAAIGFADRWSMLILLATLPLVPIFLALVGMSTAERTDRARRTLGRLAAQLLDIFEGLPTLKIYGRATAQVEAVRRVGDRHRKQTVSALRWAFLSGLVMDLLATLSVAVVAVAVGFRLVDSRITLASALVVLLLAPEVFGPVRVVGAQFHASTDALAAAAAVLALEPAPIAAVGTVGKADAPGPARAAAGARPASSAIPAIALADVTVRYPDTTADALTACTLVVGPGEVLAVVGRSGAGKSTLLSCLLGRTPATSGTVCSPGRADTAWVGQRPRSFRETAGAEVHLGNPAAADTAVAAALADCLAVASSTLLGESGIAVSAGQRRRVALARALLRARAVAAAGRTPLVLLDEPSEELDRVGAAAVAALIGRLRGWASVVVVTHDESLASTADRRVTLAAGRIVDDRRQHPTPAAEPSPAWSTGPTQDPATGDSATGDPATADAAATDPATTDARPAAGVSGPGGVGGPPARLRDVLRGLRADGTGLGGRAVGALAASIGGSAAALALTATSGWVILRAAGHPEVQVLAVAVVGVRAFALAKALLRYLDRLLAHDVALRLLTRTRARTLAALVPRALGSGRLWARGDLLRRFTADVDAVQDALVAGVAPVVSALAGALLTVGLLAWLVPSAVPVAVVGFLVLAVLPPVAMLVGRRGAAAAAAAAGDRDRAAIGLVEALPELWAYGAEGRVVDEVLAADDRVELAGRRAAGAAAAAAATASLAAAGTALAVLVVAVRAAANGSVGGLAAGLVAMVVLAAVEPIAALAPAWATLSSALERAARVTAVLTAPLPVPDPAGRPVTPPTTAVGLALDSVSLRHPDGPLVITGCDVDLRPGERIALVGPSGSGKSTLLAACLRLLPAAAGTVRLRGPEETVDILDVLPAQLPPLVAGSLQGDHLFDASLRVNVGLGRPGATEVEIADIAGRLDLADWVASLPRGWDTPCGPDGIAVSGGQRQRLLLARALLAAPRVLVLDEPTAHLDPETESVVLADLLRVTRGGTLILATHRPAGLHELDRVLDLASGSSPAGLPTACPPSMVAGGPTEAPGPGGLSTLAGGGAIGFGVRR